LDYKNAAPPPVLPPAAEDRVATQKDPEDSDDSTDNQSAVSHQDVVISGTENSTSATVKKGIPEEAEYRLGTVPGRVKMSLVMSAANARAARVAKKMAKKAANAKRQAAVKQSRIRRLEGY
jgi:uncharacterized Zn finger protein